MEQKPRTTARLVERLEHPNRKVRMVLDTDTFNEIDDQFAVAYALSSPERLAVEAIYAAPFHNERSTGPGDGMEKSYDEILRVLTRLDVPAEGFVYRGSRTFLPGPDSPVSSDAAADLVARALRSPADDPLYVVAIGAITNVASAILMNPAIIERMVVVWLGGHALYWPDTHEFNLRQDIAAARVVLDSGVPLVQIPCAGVTSHLHTTLAEAEVYLEPVGEIGRFLTQRLREYADDHFAYSKVIWDLAAVAYLVDERFVPTQLVHSPVLTDQCTWSVDTSRHLMRCATYVQRDLIFGDLFRKLRTRVRL